MNISCVICSDLLVPTAVIYTTKCGHMFHFVCLLNWIERSKSCPQCRNKVTEQKIHRVYFNLANTDSNCEDVGTLINKIENIQSELSLALMETKSYEIKVNKLKRKNLRLRKKVAKLQSDAKDHDSAIHALKDQIRYFKSKAQEVDVLSAEIEKLKNSIRDKEYIHPAIDGTREDFVNMQKNENNTEYLAIIASKKSFVGAKRKRNDVEGKNKAKKYKQDLDSLNRNLKRKIIGDYEEQLVSRNENLDFTNTSIKRIRLESPVNYNRTPKLTQPIEIVDNNDASQPVPKSILNSGRKKLENVKLSESEVNYNGLGGSSEGDFFPSPKPMQTGLKRHKPSTNSYSSHKFKKLINLYLPGQANIS